MKQRTFAMIKPNAVEKGYIGKIIALIEEGGFKLAEARLKTLKREEAEGFYAEHKQRPFFGGLVSFMTSGPVLLMVLESEDAVQKWRKLMGATNPKDAAPGTIRKIYGEDVEKNSVHGSDSPASAAREVAYFFAD